MELKYSIQRAAVIVGVLTLTFITAVAQENRSEISIQGTGFFTKDTAGNGVLQRANDTALARGRGELQLRSQHAILFQRHISPSPL